MDNIEVGMKVKIIGSDNHYLEDGSEGVVLEIGELEGVDEYAIEGYNTITNAVGRQYLLREEFEVIE